MNEKRIGIPGRKTDVAPTDRGFRGGHPARRPAAPVRPKRTAHPACLLALLLAAAACARLPDYALPRMEPVELPPEALEESFPYRPLRVADFGAPAPPASIAPHAGRINARACLQIRLRDESVVHVTQTILDGRPWYFGTVRDPAFEARMIPACSWWNPEVPAPRRAYVLQHEQIHFALMEVAARRLTDEARRTFAEWVAVEPTVPALREAVTRKLAETIEAGQVAVLAEQTEFDNDTSRVYDPRAQQRWFEEVTSALAEAPTAH